MEEHEPPPLAVASTMYNWWIVDEIIIIKMNRKWFNEGWNDGFGRKLRWFTWMNAMHLDDYKR